MQPLLGNEEFMTKLAKHNSSFFYRLYENIKDALLSKNSYTRDIEKAFEKGFREADRRRFLTGELPQFSLSRKQQAILNKAIQNGDILSIEEAVKLADKNQDLGKNSILISQSVPQWLLDIGGNTQGVYTGANHVKTIMGKAVNKQGVNLHNVSKETMYALPELLNDPLAVIDYKHDGTVIAFLKATDKEGNVVMASIVPEGKGHYNEIHFNTPFMTSAYGKEHIVNYFDKVLKKADVLYPANANKKQVMVGIVGLQLSETANRPVTHILANNHVDVNTQKDTHQYSRGIFGGNSGYEGYSMSKRASRAYDEGRKPLSRFTKEDLANFNDLLKEEGYEAKIETLKQYKELLKG